VTIDGDVGDLVEAQRSCPKCRYRHGRGDDRVDIPK
jgi:hypothetical protein